LQRHLLQAHKISEGDIFWPTEDGIISGLYQSFLISEKRMANAIDLNREESDSSENIPPSPESKSPSSRFRKTKNLTPKFTDFDPDFSPSDSSSSDTLQKPVSKRMRIESIPKRLNVSDDEDDAAEHERVEVKRLSPEKRGKKRKQRKYDSEEELSEEVKKVTRWKVIHFWNQPLHLRQIYIRLMTPIILRTFHMFSKVITSCKIYTPIKTFRLKRSYLGWSLKEIGMIQKSRKTVLLRYNFVHFWYFF
jgi:hypothetical protein